MDDRVHIALAADEGYLPGLEVTRASLVRSCSCPERLAFHIFRESPELEARIRREFGEYHGSVMAFVRLYLPELLPEVDWVVYSDVDTVWNRDVCELWELRDASKSVLWVRDLWSTRQRASSLMLRLNPGFDTNRYACSGMTVLNLKKMRETDFLKRATDFYRQHGPFAYPDQDLLNLLCHEDSVLLPACWDMLGGWEDLPEDSRCVYHITGIGRCFHAQETPVYPPQYQLWWNVRTGERGVHPRSRLLARLWPLRGLLGLLPMATRERIVRQMYFARELLKQQEW